MHEKKRKEKGDFQKSRKKRVEKLGDTNLKNELA